jgi:serine/threonine-protein kinase HipA
VEGGGLLVEVDLAVAQRKEAGCLNLNKTARYSEAYLWIWLPGEIEPVVAGKLTAEGDSLVFNYGKSYLERDNAIPIYDRELPLRPGVLPLPKGLTIPGCIRDGAPDAWGRRVLRTGCSGAKGTTRMSLNLTN